MEKIIRKGIVFDVKRYATDDGPGIRATLFFKGCPLLCLWCHNPESQNLKPELMYKRARCKSSYECVKTCPTKAVSKGGDYVSIDRKLCDSCGKCAHACPTDAMVLVGREVGANEMLKEIEKDVTFYDESGGGITFSGGEPLMQPDFLEDLLEGCKERNIHTALETCGYASEETLDRVKDKVDLFLYDIKSMDDRAHKRYTGVSNKLIIENFKRLAKNGSSISVRFPVIPGVNDDSKNVISTGEFAVSHGVKQLCLLPYHRAGTEKYRSLDRTYEPENVQAPSNEEMQQIKEMLIKLGLKVRIGGG